MYDVTERVSDHLPGFCPTTNKVECSFKSSKFQRM